MRWQIEWLKRGACLPSILVPLVTLPGCRRGLYLPYHVRAHARVYLVRRGRDYVFHAYGYDCVNHVRDRFQFDDRAKPSSLVYAFTSILLLLIAIFLFFLSFQPSPFPHFYLIIPSQFS